MNYLIPFSQMVRCFSENSVITNILIGVHLLENGQRIVFDEIMKVIRESLPDQAPENLSPIFPLWEQILE